MKLWNLNHQSKLTRIRKILMMMMLKVLKVKVKVKMKESKLTLMMIRILIKRQMKNLNEVKMKVIMKESMMNQRMMMMTATMMNLMILQWMNNTRLHHHFRQNKFVDNKPKILQQSLIPSYSNHYSNKWLLPHICYVTTWIRCISFHLDAPPWVSKVILKWK